MERYKNASFRHVPIGIDTFLTKRNDPKILANWHKSNTSEIVHYAMGKYYFFFQYFITRCKAVGKSQTLKRSISRFTENIGGIQLLSVFFFFYNFLPLEKYKLSF